MNELEKEIGGYIDDFNMQLELKKHMKKAKRQSLKELKKEFIVLAEQIIQPCMEKFKMVLEKRNQSSTIELKKPEDTGNKLPRIALKIYPRFKRDFGINSYPQISFHLAKSQKICVHAQKCMPSSGGSFVLKDEFDIGEITFELVEEKITDLIKDCYIGN